MVHRRAVAFGKGIMSDGSPPQPWSCLGWVLDIVVLDNSHGRYPTVIFELEDGTISNYDLWEVKFLDM
jgi:hypothetical protein